MEHSEYPLLDDFLCETIFVPKDFGSEIPHSIIYEDPKYFAAIKDFKSLPDDYALAAEVGGSVIGACWAGIRDESGTSTTKRLRYQSAPMRIIAAAE